MNKLDTICTLIITAIILFMFMDYVSSATPNDRLLQRYQAYNSAAVDTLAARNHYEELLNQGHIDDDTYTRYRHYDERLQQIDSRQEELYQMMRFDNE